MTIRRKPKFRERISTGVAAKKIGCSTKTVNRNSYGFTIAKRDPNIPNSGYTVYLDEVEKYLELTINLAQ